jgi:hypothetical protein
MYSGMVNSSTLIAAWAIQRTTAVSVWMKRRSRFDNSPLTCVLCIVLSLDFRFAVACQSLAALTAGQSREVTMPRVQLLLAVATDLHRCDERQAGESAAA